VQRTGSSASWQVEEEGVHSWREGNSEWRREQGNKEAGGRVCI